MTKKILIVTDNLKDQINGVVTTYKNIEICAVRDGRWEVITYHKQTHNDNIISS